MHVKNFEKCPKDDLIQKKHSLQQVKRLFTKQVVDFPQRLNCITLYKYIIIILSDEDMRCGVKRPSTFRCVADEARYPRDFRTHKSY